MPANTPPNISCHVAAALSEQDEREFASFADTQDPLDIEAATWVTRQRNGLDAQGEADLQAWLDADPRHAEAFADMDATFGDVQQLPDDDVAALKAGLSEAESTLATNLPQPPCPRSGRVDASVGERLAVAVLDLVRPLLPRAGATAVALGAIFIALGGWAIWYQQPVFVDSYATLRGQQLVATLPDAKASSEGSTLHLDTATRAEVRLYRDRREVHLQDGQAMFAVHPDSTRPFHVYAGALRITVLGTRFSVRHTDSGVGAGQTVVAVEEGKVRVARADDGAEAVALPSVDLIAGQTVLADSRGEIGAVASLSSGTVAAWRDGRLSFDQTPLAQAIAEFERYGQTGLVVRDPAVAAMPVGGSYSLKQWQRFAETLPQVLPVQLVRRGEVTEVVAR